MELKSKLAMAALAGVCALALAGPASAKPVVLTTQVGPHSISAGLSAPPGVRGWQGFYAYDVPTGTGKLFFHYPCANIPIGGSFHGNGTVEDHIVLVGNFRWDADPTQWGWVINFPGGSPAGSQIQFDVYCKR